MSRSRLLLMTSGWMRQRISCRTYSSGRVKSKILLVESPAKAKKIQDFLGNEYKVLASYGHIRDLPPKSGSVQPENNFEMRWETLRNAEKHIQSLQDALLERGTEQELYLATDPDREGEAISWHVIQELETRGALGHDANVHRISFTEITREAVTNALKEPREIDEKLVQAYLARRALDYLLGFHLSPILWRKLPGATSAGRVQSVALRLVCEREDEIEKFDQALYWTIQSKVRLPDGSTVLADLVRDRGESVPSPGYASLKEANRAIESIESSTFHVKSTDTRTISRQPRAPFTTSTLQQEANNQLGFGVGKTMQLAQELYEGGIITYMRTDSVSISKKGMDDIRKYILNMFGNEYVPSNPRTFQQKKAVNAQEAHEAIRPTDPSTTPHAIAHRGYSSPAIKLYELIRNRALASQSENSSSTAIQVVLANAAGDIELKTTASKLDFPGFVKVQGRLDDEDSEKSMLYSRLSELQNNDMILVDSSSSEEHRTKPPARYSEGSLIKAMEDLGIGRPSTYAPTLKLLYARKYVKSVNKRLHAEAIGRILTSFLRKYAPDYVDYSFTSSLEADFDHITQGREDWMEVMTKFWKDFDATTSALSELNGNEVIDMLNNDLEDYLFRQTSDVITGSVESGRKCPKCECELSLKLSHKGGAFIGCSSYPTCSYTRSLPTLDDDYTTSGVEDLEKTFKNMNMAEKYGMRGSVRLLGTHPESNVEIFVRQGPYGPYIQVGLDKDPLMKRVPLPKDAKPRSLTLKYALSMLTLPRTLGTHPETNATVEVRNGKFGPFILHGNQMRSIPKEIDPLDISLEDGLELLKASSENRRFMKKQGLDSIVTTKPISGSDIKTNVPRTRSAYQFFLKDYLAKYQMKNGKEKMKIMGEKWKSLSSNEKIHFQKMAEDDEIRFNVQQAGLMEPSIVAWEGLTDEEKNMLQSQVASAKVSYRRQPLKRPKSAYTLFMRDLSEKIKRHGGEETHKGSFMTLVAKKWRNLRDEDRAKYVEKAAKEKIEYERQCQRES